MYVNMYSFAQLKQDLEVVDYYHEKKDGYFVDIGAHDGRTLSNTYLLERYYQWKGICVEPLPDKFRHLKRIRRNSHCINQAIFSVSGLSLPFARSGLFSGLVDYIDCHLQHKQMPTFQVTTITLDEVLHQVQAPHQIDYLSIDTEGSELEVLKSINFSDYRFGIIHVEHNFIEPRRSQMRTLLESVGYHYQRENQWDDVYIYDVK